MKKLALLIATLFLFTVATKAQTQSPAVTNNGIWVITEYKFKSGPDNAQNYIKFLREHRVHILAEQKQQGLILDYKFFHSDTTAGPNEAELTEAICFRNYNDALDGGGNEELMKKRREIWIKHYGSMENMQKVAGSSQDYIEVIRRTVLHEMTFNPIKPAGQ